MEKKKVPTEVFALVCHHVSTFVVFICLMYANNDAHACNYVQSINKFRVFI